MQLRNRVIITVAVIFLLLLGIAFPFSGPVTVLFLLLVSVLVALFSLALLLSKRFRFWYLFGFLPIAVGYTSETIIREYKRDKAEAIIVQLERFKKKNQKYPKNLNELEERIEINGLDYSTDTSSQEYRLEYLMDKFNRQYYGSKSKEWGTLGWND